MAGSGVLSGITDVTGLGGVCAAEYVDTSAYESLRELFADDFSLGVAVQAIDHWNDPTAEIGNPAKEALICEQFGSITFGNELKPAYNFDASSETLFTVDRAAEELLMWAKEHGMPVRGHVLVWHSQVEPSIFAKDFAALSNGKQTHQDTAVLDEDCLVDRETLLARLRTYIRGVLEYTYENGYADVIYAWDVVNEATDENREDGLRHSYWYQIIGPEYLYYSFLYAREAVLDFSAQYADLYGLDPETDDLSSIQPKLFYNDYNEWYNARCSAILRFLTQDAFNAGHKMVQSPAIREGGDGTIRGDGLIDGIGMQGHLDDTQNIGQYRSAMEAYAEAVGEIQITELDVGKSISGDEGNFKQARFYYDFFSALLEERESGTNLTNVTIWGLTDDASWRRGADPLLFEGNLQAKAAFDAVVLAAKREAFTLTEAEISRDTSDLAVNFEPYAENGKLMSPSPEELGFFSRGAGHQAVLQITDRENHTEGAGIGRCLRVMRSEADATVRLALSRFAGETVEIRLFARTEDAELRFGLEGDGSEELGVLASDGDWMELYKVYTIPASWRSASLYIETDGSGDILLDDLTVRKVDSTEAERLTERAEAETEASEAGTGEEPSPEGAEASAHPILAFFRTFWSKIAGFFRKLFG